MVSEDVRVDFNVPIETYSASGPNGWLLPIWHVDSGVRIDQVYLTVVAPGASKGPHLHMKRCGRFTCIKGRVEVITRSIMNGEVVYRKDAIGEGGPEIYMTLMVPPGIPAMLRNVGSEPAYVLNMPSPPWRPDDQDEWPVEEWGV